MDFIETLFGVSPDGGSGLFEVGLIVLAFAAFGAIRLIRRRRL